MLNRVTSALATWVVPLWPVTIVGAALGAIAGTLVMPPAVTHSATSVISVEVPISTNQLITGTQPFSESLPDYLGGELTYLNSDGFTSAVTAKFDQSSSPGVSATRSGKADLFTLTATANSANDARRVVETAVTAYMDHVRQDNTNRYKDAVAAIDAVVPQMEQNLQNAGIVTPTPDLVALYTQRANLRVQLARAPGVIVVDPAADKEAKASPPIGTVAGGAIGGLLALMVALFWRSRSGVIVSPKQIGEQLAPSAIIPLGKSDLDATIARSLYAVLPPPRSGRIVVIGASATSETRTVADYISFAASEHGPVADVDLVNGATESAIIDAGDGTVIINAGSWASSPAGTDAIDGASQVIVVARLRFDTRRAVAKLCQAMSQRSAPFCVICVKGRSRMINRRSPSRDGQAPAYTTPTPN